MITVFPVMPIMRLRLLTYNIHKGMNSGNRRFVLHTIRESLRGVGADLVLVQEIHGDFSGDGRAIHGWPDNNQLDYLADGVWPHRAYAMNAVYRRGHHGNAVFSKFPLAVVDNVDVSFSRGSSRSLFHVVVEVPGAVPMHVICVHLGLFGFERARQLRQLARHIHERVDAGAALVVAGDFNDWRSHASRYLGEVEGLDEVFHSASGQHARTFPSWMPMLRMDRIYLRGCRAVSGEQLQGDPWWRLSDHIPLLAEIELPVEAAAARPLNRPGSA